MVKPVLLAGEVQDENAALLSEHSYVKLPVDVTLSVPVNWKLNVVSED